MASIFKPNDARPEHSGTFRFRLATPRDIPHCVELLPPGFRAEASLRRRLPEIWRTLLAADTPVFTVIEDLEQPYPKNISGFGLSVFVRDEFVEDLCAAPRPYISALFYERLLAGEAVLLTHDELAVANGNSGVSSMSLHFGLQNHDLSDPRTTQVMFAGSSAFYFFHGGYRIKTLTNEVFGAQARRFMELGGFRLVHDFQRQAPAAFAGVPADQHPYLFMLRREWVEPGVVNPLSQIFHPVTPRIHFSATERKILERALLNETDRATAAALGVSPDAIKKTWRNIFVRVDRQAPYLMPDNRPARLAGRGQEKRRHLLDYLRTHLEELRPFKTG